MKKFPVIMLLCLVAATLQAVTIKITNAGSTFSPSNVAANVGDTIVFELNSIHTVVEVTKETYDANGSASNGGFTFGVGGGTLVLTKAGTFYYVCKPHSGFGMKGMITVTDNTVSVNSKSTNSSTNASINVFPNPASTYVIIKANGNISGTGTLQLFDMTGRSVLYKSNMALNSKNQSMRVDFENNILPGRYILQINCNTESYSQLLLIQ